MSKYSNYYEMQNTITPLTYRSLQAFKDPVPQELVLWCQALAQYLPIVTHDIFKVVLQILWFITSIAKYPFIYQWSGRISLVAIHVWLQYYSAIAYNKKLFNGWFVWKLFNAYWPIGLKKKKSNIGPSCKFIMLCIMF